METPEATKLSNIIFGDGYITKYIGIDVDLIK